MTQTYTPPASEIEAREIAFRDAEASLLLEGLDPARSPEYRSLRTQVIAGSLTHEEAIQATVERHSAIAAEKSHLAVPA